MTFTINPSEDKRPDSQTQSSCIFTLKDRVGALQQCLSVFSNLQIDLNRIESRVSHTVTDSYEFYVEFTSSESTLSQLKEQLDELCTTVSILGRSASATVPWYPQHISDLDLFAHKCLQYGEELSADHPGFHDKEYRKRRLSIVDLAKNYKYGQPIPRVEYLPEEIETWGTVYRKLKSLYPTHACKQHNMVLELLERHCGYGENNIPQLEDISRFLQRCTGTSLRPVSGLLSPRDFLNGLAFRVFHSTQYIRHHSRPMYTPEPDVCHELLGHVPLFADPEFADFSQEIGIASLGASDEEIEKLAATYWFTVEFGLCYEGEGKRTVKAFGAGLLSSFGELEYCLSDKPKLQPFDPFIAAETSYPITQFQPLYFVSKSFEDAKKQLKEYSSTMSRPFDIYFNPYTMSVEKLDSKKKVAQLCRKLQTTLSLLTSTLSRDE